MIRESIAKLADGQTLTHDEAHQTLREIMSGEATPAQIAAFITALRIRGETAEVIAGSVRAMREKFTPVAPPDGWVVDTCGTGGDGAHTFNVSTASAFVTAGAGVLVAKHGNRSVSSRCGSADVLEALGIQIGIAPERMESCLRKVGIAFLFAPSLHPAMKHAIGPRKEIGIRTIFNILGPLSNPAGARRGVIGVSKALVPTMAEAAAALGAEHLYVVHGHDGLDEITTTTTSTVAEVRDGKVRLQELDPATLGIARARPEDLRGGDAAHNARMIRDILGGATGPCRDIVVLNAAAAIVAGGKALDLVDGLSAAAKSIDSGSALRTLDQLIAASSAT